MTGEEADRLCLQLNEQLKLVPREHVLAAREAQLGEKDRGQPPRELLMILRERGSRQIPGRLRGARQGRSS